MRETLLIFAGFGTVLGKAFHLWRKSTWEGISHWETIFAEQDDYENVRPCLQTDTSKSNNPVSTCHLTL